MLLPLTSWPSLPIQTSDSNLLARPTSFAAARAWRPRGLTISSSLDLLRAIGRTVPQSPGSRFRAAFEPARAGSFAGWAALAVIHLDGDRAAARVRAGFGQLAGGAAAVGDRELGQHREVEPRDHRDAVPGALVDAAHARARAHQIGE